MAALFFSTLAIVMELLRSSTSFKKQIFDANVNTSDDMKDCADMCFTFTWLLFLVNVFV